MHLRSLVLALVMLLAATLAHAEMNPNPLGLPQSATHSDPANVVELRVGTGTVGDIFGVGSGPVLSALFERRVVDALSLGLEIEHSVTKESAMDPGYGEYGYKYSHNGVAARASYHLTDLIDDPRIDLYGGGLLGYNTFSVTAFGPSIQEPLGKTSYIMLGGFGGGRVWLTPRLGVGAEVGYRYGMFNELSLGGLSWGSAAASIGFRF